MNRQNSDAEVREYLWPLLAAAAVLATAPIVFFRLPDYLPSHIAQGAAIAVGFAYFSFFGLWRKYPDWIQRSLLVVAFASPLDNLLAMKAIRKTLFDPYVGLEVFRPVIVVLIVATIGTVLARRTTKLPALLLVSAALALASWISSSLAAADQLHAFGAGFFELIIPFGVIYAYAAHSNDSQFLKHSVALFCLGFAIVAASQSAAILAQDCCALTARGFLEGKMNLRTMRLAGDNGYGNPTNFISLWVAVLPVIAGSLLVPRFRRTKTALLFGLLYAGLLVYSRSGLAVAIVGLAAVIVLMLFVGRLAIAVPVAIALIIVTHLPSSGLAYYGAGIQAFFSPPTGVATEKLRSTFNTVDDVMSGKRKIDVSGVDRANAIKSGLAIARDHWPLGMGSGHYVSADPVYTAPHSMALLRLDENGILGLASLLTLFAVAPLALLRIRRDPLAISAAIGVICFASYTSVFGGSFSDRGMIAWGFATALLITTVIADIPPKKSEHT
ncbi:O-antigen ligase family protein [Bradyrhizobium sp. 63_E2_N1_3]|uniref:O-antigen ligase family protein n=1 Tax=Bradyrhizobium sp. 63_E2_N1_3 TaxID=3240373 RepID=UPI003F8C2DB8